MKNTLKYFLGVFHKVKAQRMPQKNGKLYDLLGRTKGYYIQ